MEERNPIQWPGWEVVRLIGRGSFGTVYEIERDLFGKKEKAALKHIGLPQSEIDVRELRSDGYDDASIAATFRNRLQNIVDEYTIMRELDGSLNIIDCDDLQYTRRPDGIGWDIYIRMELATPLTDALPAQVPERTVVQAAKDLCHALDLCEKHRILHRDIKPQNIFISKNGYFKLGDFGIAKTIEKTMRGTKTGTYKYMAPEVYNNQPYGHQADLYSLGLVLYWMLNRRRMPFLPLPPAALTAETDEQARFRRLSGEPLKPPADGSEALKRIVLKACAYDPKDRYRTAAEMHGDLEKLDVPQSWYIRKNDARATGPVPPDAEDETVELIDEEAAHATPQLIPSGPNTAGGDETVSVLDRGGAQGGKAPAPGPNDGQESQADPVEPSQPVIPDGREEFVPAGPPASGPEKQPTGKPAAWKKIAVIAAAAVALIALVLILLPKGDRQQPAAEMNQPAGQNPEKTTAAVPASDAQSAETEGREDVSESEMQSAETAEVPAAKDLIFEDYTFDLYGNDTVTITGYSGSDSELTIPDRLNGHPVTCIGTQAFYACKSLTSVTIPEGVTRIGGRAFYYCTGLTSLTLPDSVTSIGNQAFCGTPWLNHQNVSDGWVKLGNNLHHVYVGNSSAVTIPDDCVSFDFNHRSSVESVIIPANVTSIGDWTFDGCSSLKRVEIPDGVTSIGKSAFYHCISLTNLTIPDSVTQIGNEAFFQCTSLTDVTIPDGVTSIGNGAFRECSSLINVSIPDSVTHIGGYAFQGCSSLTRVTIPEGVTSIRPYTFRSCGSLTTVEIPDGVTAIGQYAFQGCESLSDLVIPDGVTSIGGWAFQDCASLTSLTLPDSMTSIGERSFQFCSALTSVTIPANVTSIEKNAFSGCDSLTIHGASGSTAEWYAKDSKIPFEAIP